MMLQNCFGYKCIKKKNSQGLWSYQQTETRKTTSVKLEVVKTIKELNRQTDQMVLESINN